MKSLNLSHVYVISHKIDLNLLWAVLDVLWGRLYVKHKLWFILLVSLLKIKGIQNKQTDYNDEIKKLGCKVRFVSTPCYYGGQRWWFICPLVVNGEVCGRRVGVLYLGGGEYFGCRHCYDLTYLCQKESGKYDSLYEGMGFLPEGG
ncbi:MAG: hypothetical protein ACYSWS_04665 [Planctomycetota bacterium]|jgi:hypothetical protein